MRKLATVQKITKIEPIKDADRIELATVLGWHVVVQKGQFREGDLCIYCEIDSVLPKENPVFAFLEGKRIRTKRLRGVYSQGICFEPYPLLEKLGPEDDIGEGRDVTEFLGIKKYDPPEVNVKEKDNKPKAWYMKFRLGRWFWKHFLYKPATGDFPTWIKKTDETRVQVLQDILDKYQGTRCSVTEKVDGSSVTFWLDDKKKLHVCSRNKEIYDRTNFMYAAVEKLYGKILNAVPLKTVIQGEILGPGIQGNKYKLDDYKILVYQALNPENNEFYPASLFSNMFELFGFETVPRLDDITLTNDIDQLVNMAQGKTRFGNDRTVEREGIVIRPLENLYEPYDDRFVHGRVSFKAINPKFLVKYDQ